MQKQRWRSVSSLRNNKYTLLTGAGGFIGSVLCQKLIADPMPVKAVLRSSKKTSDLPDKVVAVQVGMIDGDTAWDNVLDDVDVVVHLAARAHVLEDAAQDPLEAFRRVNVVGTERLARMAAKAGVRRFIFISSIGVNGESSVAGAFTEEDIPHPVSAYAVSKWEAEQLLHKVARETGMEVVILRLPLVYGAKAPGNFRRLMWLIKKGLPLPLKKIHNQRSFVYVGNVVDAIYACMTHPAAANETFLLSDGENVSTPCLLKMIAEAQHKKVVLFSLPLGVLKAVCGLVGKGQELEKLTGTLVVDSSKIRRLLGWTPPFTLEEGIRETVSDG